MKYFFLALLLCCFCLPANAEKVIHVHDGDSLWLEEKVKVRIWGIDAPELGQPMGYQATQKLKELAIDKEFKCIPHGKHWKRKVCQLVSPDNVDVAEELLKAGMAYEDTRYSQGYYTHAETSAKENKLGVWDSPDGGERPWEWRKNN